MKKLQLLFFTIFSLLIIELLAQSPDFEQLLQKANESEGLEKIRALADISFKYYALNPAMGIEYGKKALRISDSLNFPSERARIYSSLGANYWYMSEYDTALVCYNKAMLEAQQSNNSSELGKAFLGKGTVYEKLGVFDSCLSLFHQALPIFKQLHDYERIGRTQENIGTIHLHRGEFKTALTFFLSANESFEKAGTIKNLPSVYLKIGRIYSKTGDFCSAEKWYAKGKVKSLELGDFSTAGIAINAIGLMYNDRMDYKNALKNYNEVLTLLDRIKNDRLLLAINGNIGNVYSKIGDKRKALIYYRQALNIAEKLKLPLQIAIQYVGIGSVYNSLHDYSNASKQFGKALPVFEKSKSYPEMLNTLEALIIANNGLKNYERSVNYYAKYITIQDSLNKNERNTALDSLKVKFNTEQTQQENTLLAQKTEIQKKTISLQQTIMVSSIIIAVLLIGLTLMIFRNRQKIKHTNTLLDEKNHEISAKADELEQKNQQLVELSHFKDSMQSFLVHDLKNPLNNLLGISTRESFEKNADGIRQTGLQMLNIVSNLLDIGKYEEEKMKLALEDVSLTQIINEAYIQTRYHAEQKSVRLVVGYSTDFIVKADAAILTRVFVNLFTNAVKFSPKGGKINILAEQQAENYLKLTVKDEGEGIPAEFQPIIFDKYSQDKVRHLGYAGSTGIGLTFCKMAIESQGGRIGVQPADGKGAAFWLTLPLAPTQSDLPANLEVFDSEATKPFSPILSNDEKTYLAPFCEILRNTSIYQISDVKEALNQINRKSENIKKWKSLVMQALSDCNEVKYYELLNLETDE